MLKQVKSFSKKKEQKNVLIILFLILLLAIFIRTYRMHELSVFIADQALMSTEVIKILNGVLTLIGPKASIGSFFFGPVVYYFMIPFYFIFNGYPIAGTVFQTVLQILTIPLIFMIGKKIKNEQVGLIASFIFTVSALLVDYSRATFNTTTALFFSTSIIYIYFSIINKYRWWKSLLIGILLGIIIQMNFITASIVFAVFLFPIFFCRKLISIKFYCLLIIGFIIGFSPYLLFEVRHNFYNSHEIINYIFHGSSGNKKSVLYFIQDLPVIISSLFYGKGVFWLGSITILFMTLTAGLFVKKKFNNVYFNFLLFLITISFIVSLLYGRHLESIYLITIHTTLIIIFAAMISFILRKKYLMILLLLIIILVLNMPNWNLQKQMHDLQDGLSMSDFDKSAMIIKNDNTKAQINVAMEAQRDNRAMPLRYFLFLYKIPVLNFDNYSNAMYLYIIVRNNRALRNINLWELRSFGSNKVIKTWKINDQYAMYKIQK